MIAFIIANSFTLMMIFIYIVTVWISINYLRYGRLFVLQGLRSSILARRERQRVASVEKIRARRREEQKLVERYYQERKIKRLEDVADWNRKFNKGTVRTEVTSTPIRGYQSSDRVTYDYVSNVVGGQINWYQCFNDILNTPYYATPEEQES